MNLNKNTKTTLAIAILSYLSVQVSFAQNISYKIVENNVKNYEYLHIRPYFSFAIPPTDLVKNFPINICVDGQYWAEKFDYRAGLSYGTFKGGSIGATFHIKNGVKSANHKFVTSRTKSGKTETTKFFRAKADLYRVSGPCADLTMGALQNAGLFLKFDFGWDIQTLASARAKVEGMKRTINSSRNGWFDIKFQGVLANVLVDETDYFKLGQGTGKEELNRKMALGFQVNPSVAISPWRTVTFYAALPMGYMKYLGVNTANTLGIATTAKGAPILSINLGASIGF